MLTKIKIYFANRKLRAAVRHEEVMRTSAEHMRVTVIPALERELEELERDAFMSDYLGGDQ